jgi:hypothetical protein
MRRRDYNCVANHSEPEQIQNLRGRVEAYTKALRVHSFTALSAFTVDLGLAILQRWSFERGAETCRHHLRKIRERLLQGLPLGHHEIERELLSQMEYLARRAPEAEISPSCAKVVFWVNKTLSPGVLDKRHPETTPWDLTKEAVTARMGGRRAHDMPRRLGEVTDRWSRYLDSVKSGAAEVPPPPEEYLPELGPRPRPTAEGTAPQREGGRKRRRLNVESRQLGVAIQPSLEQWFVDEVGWRRERQGVSSAGLMASLVDALLQEEASGRLGAPEGRQPGRARGPGRRRPTRVLNVRVSLEAKRDFRRLASEVRSRGWTKAGLIERGINLLKDQEECHPRGSTWRRVRRRRRAALKVGQPVQTSTQNEAANSADLKLDRGFVNDTEEVIAKERGLSSTFGDDA